MNAFQSMLAGINAGRQAKEYRQQEQDRNALRSLAPQIIGGDPGAYDQAAAINPEAAQQYQGAGDNQMRRLKGAIDYIESAKASGNPQNVEAAYQQVRPYLARFGQQPPATFAEAEPKFEEAKARIAMLGAGPQGNVQSTYVDDQGRRVAIMRDGSVQVLGNNAPNNQIIDTGNGFYGVNKGNLSAAPVMVGGQQQPNQAMQAEDGSQIAFRTVTGPDGKQYRIEAGNPEAEQAFAAEMGAGGPVANVQFPDRVVGGQQLRKAPAEKAPPSGYRWNADGTSMEVIPGGPAQIAADARQQAADAKQAALDAKAEQQRQGAEARQSEAAASANSLISAITRLKQSDGYKELGTLTGGVTSRIPYTDASDAQAQLDNIAGQVALATMSRLKALSAQGATGFGALSEKELGLLQNSIATLKPGISHAQLDASLKVIQDAMEKTANWKPSNAGASAGPQPGMVEDGYRFKGGNPADPNSWERI